MKKQIIIALLLFSLFVTGCSKHPEPVALEETDTPQILRDETVMFNGLEILFHRYLVYAQRKTLSCGLNGF